MTSNRHDNDLIRWSLYRDSACLESACLLHGVLSTEMMPQRHTTSNGSDDDAITSTSSFVVRPIGIQLIPEVQRHVWDLLQWHQSDNNSLSDIRNEKNSVVFPLAVEDLCLGSRATEWGLDKDLVYCKLELAIKSSEDDTKTVAIAQDEDWFVWKLERANDYRVRGNDAYKQENYTFAVQLYERALAWLEPPVMQSNASLETKVLPYPEEELQQVNSIAVACYANMATCYSKLDSAVDRCIAAASSALVLDAAHVKARYRRSQAYVSSKEFDLAIADLTKLRELEPDNKLFRSALAKAQTAKTKLWKKQQNAYATFLNE